MNKILSTAILCTTASLLTASSLAQVNSNTRAAQTLRSKTQNVKPTQPTANKVQKAYLMIDTGQVVMVTKDISYEVAAEKGATIQITNSIRNLDIRPWTESKVKIVTTVSIDAKEADTYKTTESIMEVAGINVKSFGNRVDIQARGLNRFEAREFGNFTQGGFDYIPSQDRIIATTTDREEANNLWRELSAQNRSYWSSTGRMIKTMTVFVPEDSKLDIDNRNADILINANIGTASFKLSHSNLDARNFKDLTVIADYYNINISDVEEAELELRNGTFTASTMANVDLDSENSEIEYSSGSNLYMRSQGDRMMIDEISKVDGRKLYGDLRIGKLLGSIDIEGTNADIKIRNIHQIVEKVKIVDKYADLRLPVKNLKNFTVDFHGENSTVFAGFEKTAVAYNPPEKSTTRKDTAKGKQSHDLILTNPDTGEKVFVPQQGQHSDVTGVYELTLAGRHMVLGEKAPVKFTAKEGDVQAKHTKFEIVCHQCSVDFK